jgi:hypothetical protein
VVISLSSVTTKTEKRASQNKRATPWGAATLVAEAQVRQKVGDKRFAVLVELLESGRGEALVRLSYSTDGVARRGPVTLRARDLERLRSAVARRPELAQVFGLEAT